MAASRAAPKLEISKPLTMELASQKIKALITRVNRPRVRKLIGKVRSSRIGLTSALSSPKTREVMSAAQKLAKPTPGTILATINKTKVFKSQRSNSIFSFRLLLFDSMKWVENYSIINFSILEHRGVEEYGKG